MTLGCNHATYTVRKYVDSLIVNDSSTVNLCAMTLSKACDRTNHH
jgi:hypothetical protein